MGEQYGNKSKVTGTYLVSCNAIPIDQHKLEADIVKTISTIRNIEYERLVEYRTKGTFLHARLPLCDALRVVQKIDLDIWIR